MQQNKIYIAIDLKSFYASVECVERGYDPLTTNLVVADESRTEKTICLAVSPSLKAYGIPGRARLFEVVQKVREVNNKRRWQAPNKKLVGESFNDAELKGNPTLAVSYVVAPPQMKRYMDISTKIYATYLKYIAPEDIHVYSIDEVFIDATDYLRTYNCTAHELAMRMIRDVLDSTGITATAGIGTNLYLCKIAMDIVAKHIQADKDGVRIAELDEMSYRKKLWNHKPLTDFWRVGKGYATKLEQYGIYTMGDIARVSERNEALLYKLFGVNAELLIDHAWGWEPCTIADIKAYKPENNSISSGQVLQEPYPYKKAKVIVHEMADLLSMDLVEKRLMTNQIVLEIGYDVDNEGYDGEYSVDRYGRKIPKHAHGTENIEHYTSSTKIIIEKALTLFDRIINKDLNVRRVNITACKVLPENEAKECEANGQLSIFDISEEAQAESAARQERLEKERREQEAILGIRKKYGKNAVLKGVNFEEGATTKERNGQVGGHKA